ncbi:hypothetical protein HBI25_127430 [Parastagonospora nodorum]|nr:hypothetical protein HBI10_189180 [Parastagonospora nodorum]KAH4013565.1 hypothetical protein HBI13_178010 [Parastagonospora nodorum]KAH4183755.1 hypothetical protein HBH42_198730 [Parastagonospora nodorum]KAH5051244.1 hypothetical protein HBH96_175250 [Parastagonospora nodorum]KAH5303320.1 hypothetical protein HBI12_180130 [Parastagonospora nodorum]
MRRPPRRRARHQEQVPAASTTSRQSSTKKSASSATTNRSPTRASLVHHTPHDGPQHSAGAPSCPCNAPGYPTKPCPPRRNKLPLSQRL